MKQLTPELIEHLETVLDYLWEDEQESFLGLTTTEEAQGHVFNSLVAIQRWLAASRARLARDE